VELFPVVSLLLDTGAADMLPGRPGGAGCALPEIGAAEPDALADGNEAPVVDDDGAGLLVVNGAEVVGTDALPAVPVSVGGAASPFPAEEVSP
jgi:hypothetical protein